MSEILHSNPIKIAQLDAFLELLKHSVGDMKTTVVHQHRALLDTITPFDILYLKDYRDDSMQEDDEIILEAGKVVNVFFRGLSQYVWDRECSVLMKKMLKENQAIRAIVDGWKPLFAAVHFADVQEELLKGIDRLADLEQKFTRQEHVLFPRLEPLIPSKKPLRVLWRIHDSLRKLRLEWRHHLLHDTADGVGMRRIIGEYYIALYGLLQKEELILFPIASKLLSPAAWKAMEHSAAQIGFPFLDEPFEPELPHADESTQPDATFRGLAFEELDLIFQTIPLDITYVDERNVVRYYNETAARHFPRTKEVIGRNVEQCHPAHSVHIVLEIIERFRNRLASQASFWIRQKERLLYINYYAVYDKRGEYRGVLETTQDVTAIQRLEGERRLVSWK